MTSPFGGKELDTAFKMVVGPPRKQEPCMFPVPDHPFFRANLEPDAATAISHYLLQGPMPSLPLFSLFSCAMGGTFTPLHCKQVVAPTGRAQERVPRMNDGDEFSSGGESKPCHLHACLSAAVLLRFVVPNRADQNPGKGGKCSRG